VRLAGAATKDEEGGASTRMRRVLDYIDRHLDGDLDLETVSGVATFSKFHFYGPVRPPFTLSRT